MKGNDTHKYILMENDLPRAWYNLNPDLPSEPEPLLDPQTGEPMAPEAALTIMPQRVLEEAASMERWVEIPEQVQEAYRTWRPTPLFRARRLEQALDTPAHLYYKYEGASPVGSHKLNTAMAQAHGARGEGLRGLATETGAGQWGSAMAMACAHFGLECHVFMVRVSYTQKPYRRVLMQTFGANVEPSPSDKTEVGRGLLNEDAEAPGSLGIAVSEAVETAVRSAGEIKIAIGSALSPVLMHQTVIGLEALKQFEMAGEYPDVLIGCVGAGSNLGGFTFPFLRHNDVHSTSSRIVAVEPTACPTLTKGHYGFDYADASGVAPLVKMHTLGHGFIPPGIHAGGLRYHGMAPQVSVLYEQGVIEAVAVPQVATFEAAVRFARAEGILPAPESAHAVQVAIAEALRCKAEGTSEVIAFNLSGHGFLDLTAYESFLKGSLEDFEFPEDAFRHTADELPKVASSV